MIHLITNYKNLRIANGIFSVFGGVSVVITLNKLQKYIIENIIEFPSIAKFE